MEKKYGYEDFLGIMDTLLGENGCPWDRAQTHESLRRYVIEEAYEVVEAIDNNDMKNLCEELGDLFFQVVFHAGIEKTKNSFTMDDVIDGISRKMVSRHSHIFGSDTARTPEEVLVTWDANKKKEKGYTTQTEVLRAVPRALPALTRAEKVLSKAETAEYERKSIKEDIEKIEGLLSSLKAAEAESGDSEALIGEILLNLTDISIKFQINPEFALTKATEQFINKFECNEKIREKFKLG